MVNYMSYINRLEEQKQQQRKRNKENKSARRMKCLVVGALVLSSISLGLSAYAANVVWHSNSADSGYTTVVPPKFAGTAKTDVESSDPQAEGSNPQAENNEDSENQNTVIPSEITQNETKDTGTVPPSTEGTKPVDKGQPSNLQKKPTAANKVIYLTFDDGPSKYTEQIVDILNQKGIHATFFMIGNQLAGNEKKVKTTMGAGNYVGLHSMSHDKKKLYQSGSSAKFIKEFEQEQALMEKITGTTPWLIRAPYGSKPEISGKFLDDIAEANFKMWDWTVDSKDWKYPDKPERIIQEVKRQVHRDTEVILMHEKSQTVQVLPEVIDLLRKKGYSFAVYKPDLHFAVNFAKDQRL